MQNNSQHIKNICGVTVNIQRLSTTDISITLNGNPVIIQTHRLETFFTLIERCMIEERHKQGSLFSDKDYLDRIDDQLEK